MSTQPEHLRGTVLIVEDDHVIGTLVEEILTAEGFAVSLLDGRNLDTLHDTVARLEPDCILLDGESPLGYGTSWTNAAWIATRDWAVPVIMFTGHDDAVREAKEQLSVRSQGARFAGIVPKPFRLNQLITTVSRVVHAAHSSRENNECLSPSIAY